MQEDRPPYNGQPLPIRTRGRKRSLLTKAKFGSKLWVI